MDLLKEKRALIKKLKENLPKDFKVVVMPHFCVDNFVHYEQPFESFIKDVKNIVLQGGGNIPLKQNLHRGGKAANCASALASLDVHTYLIAKTNSLGYKLLEHFFGGKCVDLSHVSKDGELAFTTALELKGVNIMLSYPGSLSKFGPECISEKDEELIKEADVVCISDWGMNDKGTELAKHVFSIAKEGKALTFFDLGDPSPKKEKEQVEINRVKTILEEGLVDILSVNEDEIKRYGGVDFLRTVTRIDLHTEQYVKTYYKDKETEKIPTFNVEPIRLTGAGDAWNSGDILAELLHLPDAQRLMLANAVAAYYISHPAGAHASREKLAEFLQSAALRTGIL